MCGVFLSSILSEFWPRFHTLGSPASRGRRILTLRASRRPYWRLALLAWKLEPSFRTASRRRKARKEKGREENIYMILRHWTHVKTARKEASDASNEASELKNEALRPPRPPPEATWTTEGPLGALFGGPSAIYTRIWAPKKTVWKFRRNITASLGALFGAVSALCY